jgi:hypothetical protein
MDTEGFRQFLQGRKVPEDKLDSFISIADKFEGALQGHTPDSSDVETFAMMLIREGLNTWDNFIALARYGQFLGNNEVYREAIALLDGSEVLDNLHERLGKLVGEQKRDEILAGIDLPPLGLPSSHKPRILQAVMGRLEAMLDAGTCGKLLSSSLRTLNDSNYLEDKKKYQACASLDEFLVKRGQDFIAELEQLKREGRLFFTQEVTDDVIAFVRGNPLISQGVREGNVLYETKIPYMTKEYLVETDERMKRYCYCHCPWVRESIKKGDVPAVISAVSPTFCQCSAGFVKKPWEVILGQPLKAEVVESILTGALWCKIAIHLPDGI